MTRSLLLLLLSFIFINAHAQAPSNDELINATVIANVDAFCSADAAYTNVGATTSAGGIPQGWGTAVGKDVWFKFVAQIYDVSITVSGKVNATSTNTMLNPLVALYTRDAATNTLTEITGSATTANNATILYKGALIPGQEYLIRVSARNSNEGTFKLCVDNYFAPLVPGQDCATVSILCNMDSFTQNNVTGAGNKNNETAGTCLGQESNSAWYMWTAGTSGTFTFLITPTVITNDIDWVLYDLGPGGTCAQATAANAIRCAAGSGVDCTPSYYITGLSMTETDLREESGCPTGRVQNGLVRYVDMIAGHNYALIVDNFSSNNNGFHIDFGGTTQFVGPTADFKMERNDACTPQQSYTFTNLSSNYQSLKWTFGNGASITTSDSEGPITVTYATPGEKVVVLEAKSVGGCSVVQTLKFTVINKPALPSITSSTNKYCAGNAVTLSTPKIDGAIYHWSGPNGFASSDQNPTLNITGPENSGDYELYLEVGYCKSDVAKFNVPTIDLKPEAIFEIATNNFCQNNLSFTFKNTSLNYATSSWDFGAGVVSVINEANGNKTVVYGTAGTKTIILSVNSPSGCVATITQTLEVQLKPVKPSITVSTLKLCPGNDVTLSTSAVENGIYHWSGTNNFVSSEQNPKLTITGPENSGQYQLIVQVGDCLSDAALVTIPPIDLKPEALFDIVVNFKCLPNQSFTFVNNSKNYKTVNWDFGTGITNRTVTSNGNNVLIYGTNGVKEITLTVTSESGCTSTLTKQIEVQLKPATPILTSNRKAFCLGETIELAIDEGEGLTYNWIGPNNFTASSPSITIPVTNFDVAGVYQVFTQIGECRSDVVRFVVPPIARVPVASFGTIPGSFNWKYSAPLKIIFKNLSKDADSYLWDFGDGTTSTAENPTHVYTSRGTFKIKLTAFADEGCSNSATIGDLVIGNATLFIPNAFSPNSDGINDEFVITILNLKKYQLSVYNRLGERIFESFNIFDNWKGTYKNQDLPVGVYYYVITGRNVDDIDLKYSGSITLIR